MAELHLSVREAEESDAAALSNYIAELIEEKLPTLVLFASPPSVEEERTFIRSYLQSSNSVLLLAFLGNRLVGQLDFRGAYQPQRAHGGAMAMSVHREHRGQGIGGALIESLISWVEAQPSLCRVELEVLSNNRRAQELYERHGFVSEGRRVAAVIHEGRSLDAILMAKRWPEKGAA